jgi:O-antigen/teichoic acid export membrane protein
MASLTLAWVLPFLPASIAAALALRSSLSRPSRPATSTSGSPEAPSSRLGRDFWRYTLPRGVARACQVALLRLDIVLVAAIRSPAEAAVYAAATRFLVLGQVGVQAVQQVIQPQLSRLLALKDREATREVFQAATAWLVLLCWPLYLTVAQAAPVLLGLFGEEYRSGIEVVVVLSLTMLFATATGPVDVALTMAGRSGLSLAFTVLSLAVTIVLDLALIPLIGILGAAVGWSVAIVLRNVLTLWQVHRELRLSALSPALLWACASALGCFGVVPLAARLTLGDSTAVIVSALAVGAALYAGTTALGRDRLGVDVVTAALTQRKAAT